MADMAEFDTRTMIHAAAAAATANAAMRGRSTPRRLGAAASAAAAEYAPPAYSQVVLAGLVRLIEFGLIALIGIGIYGAYLVPSNGFEWYYIATIGGIAALAILAVQSAGLYQLQAFWGHAATFLRLASAWSLVFFVAISISFFAKAGEQYSRFWLAAFFACGAAALIGFRLALAQLVRQWMRDGRLERRTVVVGADQEGERLIHALAAQRDSGLRVLGVFDDRGDDRAGMTCGGRPKLGTVDDLVEFARRSRVDLVIFSLPITAEKRILQMLKKLWVLPVDIRLSAHTNKLRFRPRSYSYIGGVPVLDVFDRPITDWDVVVKSLFDRIVGSLILLAALPVMAVTAIASNSTAAVRSCSSKSATASTTN
jgi:FlaA1/EpsC-like NDP-sugar epimerase